MSNTTGPGNGGAGALTPAGSASAAASQGGGGAVTNLADVLERVLDKGIVVVGDIRVNLLDIELLTIKLRLLVAGVDTARRIGIDWWEHDPWLSGRDDDERRSLASRVSRLERELQSETGDTPELTSEGAEPTERELERPSRGRASRSRDDRGSGS
jgi:hypothetical protein